jgi:segregation and condensation protein A
VHPGLQVKLPSFEGPLDLLLHLIREHKLDVFDIPIALIAEKYNQSLRADGAPSTWTWRRVPGDGGHARSHQEPAAPAADGDAETGETAEEQGDPRGRAGPAAARVPEVQGLARQLAENPLLDREVFARRITPAAAAQVESAALAEVSVYRLIEALDRVLKALEPRVGHEVVRDQLTLSAAMQGITARLRPASGSPSSSCSRVSGRGGRSVVTFLALLEMVKLRLLRVHQDEGAKEIWVSAEAGALDSGTPEVDEREYS